MTEAEPPALWHLVGPIRTCLGFAYGSRYPSLLCHMSGPDLAPDIRAMVEEALARLLAGDNPTPGIVQETADATTLEWLLRLVDLCQISAGLPVFEPARVIKRGPDAALCQIASLGRSLSPLSVLLQCLLALIAALVEGRRDQGLEAELVRLHGILAKTNFRSSNVPRFIRAAHEMDLPFRELPGQFLLLGQGKHGRWLDSTFTDATPFISTQIARNKLQAAAHLRLAGLPVPPHHRVGSSADAISAAKALGYPVVVKPANLDGGTGVAAGLVDAAEVSSAFDAARRHSSEIIVEKHIEGRDYRLTVFEGETVWAVERVPGGVTGDGRSSIADLVASTNADSRRGIGDHAALKRLSLDSEAMAMLDREGLSPESVPTLGRFVRLRRAANVASGGMPVAVFDQVHPENLRLAVRAAEALRLDLAGVDLIIPDIARSWREGGAAICEVNAQPQLGGTTSAHVYPQILKAMVAGSGRIPCAILAGFGADGTLAHEVGLLLDARGLSAGWFDGKEVCLAGERSQEGACQFRQAGDLLVASRDCSAMVLQVPAEENLANGLPFTRYDVLAIGSQALPEETLELLQRGNPAHIINGPSAEELVELLLRD